MTLGRRMFLASLLLALFVGAAFAALIVAISAQKNATERETRSREITAEVLRLEKLVVDMETGTRGLVITGGNMIFFEPYPQAKRQLPTHLSQLKELVAADLLEHLDPGEAGQHHVEDDQVGGELARRGERLGAVRRLQEAIAAPEHRADELAQARVVVADEDRRAVGVGFGVSADHGRAVRR